MVALYLAISLVVGYLLGSINFARIFTWWIARKDITKEGSKNPGTMNILRTRGLGEAFLTLAFDALKVGAPALAAYFVFGRFFGGYADLAYFVVAFAGIFGHCFPIYYKFHGGKGVASTFGMFLFNPHLWWLSLVMFVLCFVLFFFLQYGFIISHIFIVVMSLYASFFFGINRIMWFWIIITLLWLNFIMVVVKHRGNFKRFFEGTENKVDFKERVFGKLMKKKKNNVASGGEGQQEEQSASTQSAADNEQPADKKKLVGEKAGGEGADEKADVVNENALQSTQNETANDADKVVETAKKQGAQKKSASQKGQTKRTSTNTNKSKSPTKEVALDSKKGKKTK